MILAASFLGSSILVGVFVLAILSIVLMERHARSKRAASIARSREDRSRNSKNAAKDRTQSSVVEPPRTLEQGLALLAECGLQLAEPFGIEDLLREWSREHYEEGGLTELVDGLASIEERPPYRTFCSRLFRLDLECIEDHGAYKSIAEEMIRMTCGALLLDDLTDYVDIDGDSAWLGFTFRGDAVRIDFQVDDDWMDPQLLSRFQVLLSLADPDLVYVLLQGGDQQIVIGCVRREELRKLMQHGVAFSAIE